MVLIKEAITLNANHGLMNINYSNAENNYALSFGVTEQNYFLCMVKTKTLLIFLMFSAFIKL